MKQLTCATSRSSQTLLLVVFFSIAIASKAENNETSLGGSFGLGSDFTFRGVSQTMGNHSVQASVDIGLSSGIYAYVWGSNVDFVPEGEPDDGARYEIDLAIGYSADLSDDWSVDLALIRYLFPGTINDADYDYNELMATLTRNIGNTAVTLDYVDTHDSADLIFSERTIGPRYVLSVQFDW